MNKLILMAGPCVIESEQQLHEIAAKLKKITDQYECDYYFKASFDKANRTSVKSYRGVGIKEGIRIFQDIKNKYGLRVVTDIHEPYQAEMIAEVADIIQIPAFLCRQTDLLVAAGKTGKIISVKKAQFLAPWDMKNVVEKLESTGNHNLMLCERGTTFGYNRLIVDMTAIIEMKKFGYPVIFDATHSTQMPGGNGDCTGGNREYSLGLTKAAIAIGADGVFLETHEDPKMALSDGPNMIPMKEIEKFISNAIQLFKYEKGEKIEDEY